MAAVNTGMSRGEMKKLMLRAKEEPVGCAIGQGDGPIAYLLMDRIKPGRAVEKALKDEFPDVKNSRFGTVSVNEAENPKLARFVLNRAVSGMARRLIKTLKGTGINKVAIGLEDGSLVEDYEEEDEEAAVDGEVLASVPQETAPPPPPPPPGPPPPAAGKTPEEIAAQTAALAKLLATLAPQIPKAAGEDAARKAALMKFATDANVNIKAGNLVYAANALDQLKRALEAPTTPPPADLQTLTASRQQWTAVQEKVKAEIDKLGAELAKTYQGEEAASEINAAFRAKAAPVTAQFDDRLLDVLDDLMNTKDAAERDTLMGQARGLIKTYLSFAMTDPFIGELDANPFVKLAIRPTVTGTLANLAKTMH